MLNMRKVLLIGSLLYLTSPFANAIKLPNFQKLTVDVSEACEEAYDRTIPGCRAIDFDPDGTCSPGCVSGLNEIASGVLGSCGGVVVGSSSLLGKIFNGDIIPSLCPNNGGTSSAPQQKSSTAAPATTAQPTSQAAPKSSKEASTTAAASSASAGSPSSSAAPISESSAAPSGSSSGLTVSSASSSTSSSAAVQTSPSQSQTQPDQGKSGLTVQQQQIAAMSHSGGGSPFDIVGYSAAGRLSSRDASAVTLGLTLLIIGWLLI